MRVVSAFVTVALAMGGCSDSASKRLCTPPMHTTYSCEPIAAGGSGCVGGPRWTPVGSADAGVYQDDVDTTFPSGCTAQIPDCSPYYMGDPREFLCAGSAWSEQL